MGWQSCRLGGQAGCPYSVRVLTKLAPAYVQVSGSGSISCDCAACGEWKASVEGTPGGRGPSRASYEVYTQEFVAALALYLRCGSCKRDAAALPV